MQIFPEFLRFFLMISRQSPCLCASFKDYACFFSDTLQLGDKETLGDFIPEPLTRDFAP